MIETMTLPLDAAMFIAANGLYKRCEQIERIAERWPHGVWQLNFYVDRNAGPILVADVLILRPIDHAETTKLIAELGAFRDEGRIYVRVFYGN